MSLYASFKVNFLSLSIKYNVINKLPKLIYFIKCVKCDYIIPVKIGIKAANVASPTIL